MELIFQACAFALVCLIVLTFLNQHSPHTAALAGLAACVGLLILLAPQLYQLMDFCRRLALGAGLDGALLASLYKGIGVALCARLTAELCRDQGQRALAAKVELCGAVCGLICALPLLQRALSLAGVG